MKRISDGRNFKRICAAAGLAFVLSPSPAREPAAEWKALMYAPARVPGLTPDGTPLGLPASRWDAGPTSCPATAGGSAPDAGGPDPTLLRKLAGWWQCGLVLQSRALIP